MFDLMAKSYDDKQLIYHSIQSFFFNFWPQLLVCNMWYVSPPAKGQMHAPCKGNTES